MCSPDEELSKVLSKINDYAEVSLADVRHWLDQASDESKYHILKTRGPYGNTALHDAACNGQTSIVRMFLTSVSHEQRVVLLREPNKFKNTALEFAALNNRVETIDAICDVVSREGLYSLLEIQKGFGTPIHTAAIKGHLEALRSMLTPFTAEQQRQLVLLRNCQKETAIDLAIRRKHGAVADYLHRIANYHHQHQEHGEPN